jgi:hypothetical protein
MITALIILIPCCLVGLGVYAAMSRWELTPEPDTYRPGDGGTRRNLPRLTLRETVVDWPIPQLERLQPSVLIAISAVLAVWIIAWIVLFFVGLSMLHA